MFSIVNAIHKSNFGGWLFCYSEIYIYIYSSIVCFTNNLNIVKENVGTLAAFYVQRW